MEPFENIASIIPKVDEICALAAVCELCSEDAAFTMRTIESQENVLVGGAEMYKPVCKSCYMMYTKKI